MEQKDRIEIFIYVAFAVTVLWSVLDNYFRGKRESKTDEAFLNVAIARREIHGAQLKEQINMNIWRKSRIPKAPTLTQAQEREIQFKSCNEAMAVLEKKEVPNGKTSSYKP